MLLSCMIALFLHIKHPAKVQVGSYRVGTSIGGLHSPHVIIRPAPLARTVHADYERL